MNRGRMTGLVLAVSVALVAGRSGGAGLRDVADGWLVPAPATANGTAWVALGSMRLHGLPELATWSLSAGVGGARGLRPAVAMSWQRTGRDLFRADAWRAHVAWGGFPGLGLEARGERLALGGDPVLRPVERRWLAVVGQVEKSWTAGRMLVRVHLPLAGVSGAAQGAGRRPFARFVWSGPRTGLAGDLSRDRTGRPMVGWSAAFRTRAASCGLRGEPATGVIGPVLAVRRGLLVVRTSHVVHPVLGVTHRVEVGWGRVDRSPW